LTTRWTRIRSWFPRPSERLDGDGPGGGQELLVGGFGSLGCGFEWMDGVESNCLLVARYQTDYTRREANN
jgi:hypothetical protein